MYNKVYDFDDLVLMNVLRPKRLYYSYDCFILLWLCDQNLSYISQSSFSVLQVIISVYFSIVVFIRHGDSFPKAEFARRM